MVETSGHVLGITSDASVNTAAPHGTAGDWLLDPDNITIIMPKATPATGQTSLERPGDISPPQS